MTTPIYNTYTRAITIGTLIAGLGVNAANAQTPTISPDSIRKLELIAHSYEQDRKSEETLSKILLGAIASLTVVCAGYGIKRTYGPRFTAGRQAWNAVAAKQRIVADWGWDEERQKKLWRELNTPITIDYDHGVSSPYRSMPI